MAETNRYKTIDLCAGIGGIRKGFELTKRFENILSAEIDEFACLTYEHLFGENPKNDITTESFLFKVKEINYDVLLAGFPCQAFSSVGKRLGFKDTIRGTIFFHIAEIVSGTNPKAIFLENVQNLLSHDEGRTIRTIIEMLEHELRYKVIGVKEDANGALLYSSETLIRNTKFFGLPQNRPRVYIMAFSKDYFGPAILKIKNKSLPREGEGVIFNSVLDILDVNVDDKYYMSSGYWETLKRHKTRQKELGNGFGYCIVNQGKRKRLCSNTLLATGGSGKERNLVLQPKEGVSGKKLPTKKSRLNDEGIRVMTPNEWGKLQGFIGYAFLENNIDTFGFPDGVTDGQKYKQLGNSVSIPVIKAMALFMLDCLDLLINCNEKRIHDLAGRKAYFTCKDVMMELKVSYAQANYLLEKLVKYGYLCIKRKGRIRQYYLNDDGSDVGRRDS